MKKIIASIISITAVFVFTINAFAATTVVVTGNTSAGENQPGWMFNRDTNTDTPFEFNTDEKSMGTGSLYVMPIGANAADKFVAENFLRSSVAELNSIAYDFMIAGNGEVNDAQEFYLNVYATIDNSTEYYDCRFDYVPNTGSTSNFTTATSLVNDTPVNVVKRGSRIDACPTTLAGMPVGSYVRAFSISVGDTSTNDIGLAGYLDKVVVDLDSDVKTYDLEPFAPTGQITNPATNGAVVSGNYNFTATYNDGDDDNDDAVQWAIRQGTCSGNTVIGNVDGRTDTFTWNGAAFAIQVNTANLTPGNYCFVFNPTDDAGQADVRVTRTFVVNQPNPGVEIPAQCDQNLTYNVINGTNGSNVINGTNGDDLIFARGGSDKVDGRGGNDCIVGGDGSDVLKGGSGMDVILGGDGSDSIEGDSDADKLYGEGGSDSLKGGSGDDHLWGGNGTDSLSGDSGNDVIKGEAGTDSLRGGAGADNLDGGAGMDSANGEGGSQDVCVAESKNSCEL